MRPEDYQVQDRLRMFFVEANSMRRALRGLGAEMPKSMNQIWLEKWSESFCCDEANNAEEYNRYQSRIFEAID